MDEQALLRKYKLEIDALKSQLLLAQAAATASAMEAQHQVQLQQ